jgi:hypothetical protein
MLLFAVSTAGVVVCNEGDVVRLCVISWCVIFVKRKSKHAHFLLINVAGQYGGLEGTRSTITFEQPLSILDTIVC